MDVDIKIKEIIRTNRKSIAIQIMDDSSIVIRAPHNVSEDTINSIVSKNKYWIHQRKKEIESRDPKFSPKEYVNGEGFLYLGDFYKLTIVDNQNEPLIFKNGFYLSKNALPNARDVFIEWYKKEAYKKISERVEWYAKKEGYEYNKIKITNAQKRWASCSPLGNLNFSWRLIMSPLRVIDYVVIHELVHLKENNHSKSFWNKVKVIMSDYEKYDDWLKKNGHLLKI